MSSLKVFVLYLSISSIFCSEIEERSVKNIFSSISTSCSQFSEFIFSAKIIGIRRRQLDRDLQADGFILHENDIGYEKKQNEGPKKLSLVKLTTNRKPQEDMNIAGFLAADKSDADLAALENSQCFKKPDQVLLTHPKYKTIDNYGNNLKHPTWGTPQTAFGRFAPKSYDDGVRSIRKSVTGSELPSARKIAQNVMIRAPQLVPPKKPARVPNFVLHLFVLYLTHELAHQIPVAAHDNDEKIRCCGSGNRAMLPPALSHSECLPISIGKIDRFYGPANVKCLNMVRSETSSQNIGEVLNAATSVVDHSIIYGVNEELSRQTRSFRDGKLNLGPKNLLAVDSQGKYTKSTDRLTAVPIGAVIPVLFSRNHNNIAKGLKTLNPSWNDERLFQEARRINIAIFQCFIHKGTLLHSIAKSDVNETYNENINSATSVEFSTAAYRFIHYFTREKLPILTRSNEVKDIFMSDTLGRMDILENNFDDVLRGLLNQQANYGEYTDEIYNKLAKNQNGIGIDLVAIDIQRGRDHGIPPFLEIRRKCGLDDMKTFDDLLKIFPQEYVDLLKDNYDSVEDIDFYVGGGLESFTTFDTAVLGETFGCTIVEQFKRTMGGDAYFYSHKTSPYPFNDAQIAAINEFKIGNFICENSNLESVRRFWFLTDSPLNPNIPCNLYTRMNLTAWKNI